MPAATSGERRNVPRPAGHASHDAREDDEADAVADAALGDQLADPHHQDGAGGEREQLGERRRAGEVEVRDDAVAGALRQDGQVAVGLEQGHRHGQVARVLVDLVAAVLALARELLEAGHDARHQLHDDRGVDVGVHAQRDDREASPGRRPRTGRAAAGTAAGSGRSSSAWRSTPGTGTCARPRTTTSMPRTNRIRRRMSGARKALTRASNTATRPGVGGLARAATGGRGLGLGLRRVSAAAAAGSARRRRRFGSRRRLRLGGGGLGAAARRRLGARAPARPGPSPWARPRADLAAAVGGSAGAASQRSLGRRRPSRPAAGRTRRRPRSCCARWR